MPTSRPPVSAPPSSLVPPSLLPPRSGGTAKYLVGLLVLAAATGGLIYWKTRGPEPPAPAPSVQPSAQPEAQPYSNYSPPPPPEEDLDAGLDAGPDASARKVASGGTLSADGPCTACGSGVSTPALESAVRSRAGLATGCYQRELRTGGSEGSMSVALNVGAHGGVCSANIASDTLGSPGVAQCVISKLSAGSFPKPKQGCVSFRLPITFKAATR